MFKKIYVNCKKDYGQDIKNDVFNILKDLDLKVVKKPKDDIDLAILIGGDGTLLREQCNIHCPILGINPGASVGFYLKSNKDDYKKKIVQIVTGKHGKDYFVHSLTRLETKLNGKLIQYKALNDVLISPVYVRKILDAELIATFKKSLERNTGIIAYTPTGSHAFAKSAGASELLWDSKRFGLVAIAPYDGSLKKNEMLAEKESFRVKVLNDVAELCIDGQDDQVINLKKDDVIQISKSILPARLVAFEPDF